MFNSTVVIIRSLISPAEMFRLLLSSIPSIPLQLNVSFYLYLIPIHDIDCQGATYRLVHSYTVHSVSSAWFIFEFISYLKCVQKLIFASRLVSTLY